ncbi:MAG: hypothetical protein J2P15_20400 [Micromonosporaceae bacterium]|nr:hypothetical protein [Micromonosporaceae bacterium]
MTREPGKAGEPRPAGEPGMSTEERLLRVGGLVVALLLGFALGVWDIFLGPLYAGSVPLPVAPVLAIAGNLGLIWFTRTVTGSRRLALVPGIIWFATMLVGANRTHEGDALIPGNEWMGLVALLLVAATWGLSAYRMMLPDPDQRAAGRPTPAGQKPSAKPAATKPESTKDTPARRTSSGAPRPGARPAAKARRR